MNFRDTFDWKWNISFRVKCDSRTGKQVRSGKMIRSVFSRLHESVFRYPNRYFCTMILPVAALFLVGTGAGAGEITVHRRSKDAHLAPEHWKGGETAVIVCDMWDRHWCEGASSRVREMAPVLNDFLKAAREKGATVIHAPSSCMKFYGKHPARLRIAGKIDAEVDQAIEGNQWLRKLPVEQDVPWPIDQSDGGCDCEPKCAKGNPWTRQIDSIDIDESVDLISDHGPEIATFLKENGIKNVMMTGVHTNMCVVGRPFGLRKLARFGRNVVLVRDLTDSMYDPRKHPFVSHFEGTDLVVGHIEKYICPTILSTDLSGNVRFRFSADKRTEPDVPARTPE